MIPVESVQNHFPKDKETFAGKVISALLPFPLMQKRQRSIMSKSTGLAKRPVYLGGMRS